MKIIILVGFILIASGCIRNSNICNSRNDSLNEGLEYGRDFYYDTVLLSQDCGLFIFIYKHILTNTLMDVYLAEVVLKRNNMKMLLFDDYHLHDEDSLIYAYDDYYMFVYFSGGNNCRAEGYHVIKVLPDTACYVGLVSGYADIDSNGVREFYYIDVVEYGETRALNKTDSFPCGIIDDSMTYPGLMYGF